MPFLAPSSRTFLLVILLIAARTVSAGILAPNPDKGAGLTTSDTYFGQSLPLGSLDFAQIMAQALAPAGVSNVKNATFLFQECFGGAMLYDLSQALKNDVVWAGGSASAWNQKAFGQIRKRDYDAYLKIDPKYNPGIPVNLAVSENPVAFWSQELRPELGKKQSVLSAIEAANKLDPVGSEKLKKETGQSGSSVGNGGDTFQLTDAATKSYRAILWAGKPDEARHLNAIDSMAKFLISKWGNPKTDPNVTITIMYGSGGKKFGDIAAISATERKLKETMKAIPLNKDTQFLFYASNHGSMATVVRKKGDAKKIAPKASDSDGFDLDPDELDALVGDPFNISMLDIDYLGAMVGGQVEVILNGVSLGFLDPGLTNRRFQVPDSILALVNELRFTNGQSTEFTLLGTSFLSGDVDLFPAAIPIPEPTTQALAAIALMWLLVRLQRNHGFGSPSSW